MEDLRKVMDKSLDVGFELYDFKVGGGAFCFLTFSWFCYILNM